jgi:hypothetical protein
MKLRSTQFPQSIIKATDIINISAIPTLKLHTFRIMIPVFSPEGARPAGTTRTHKQVDAVPWASCFK